MPEDIAIVSFDDLPLAQYADPPLTTMHQPVAELDANAVKLLIDQIQGQPPADLVRLPVQQVVRGSCGAVLC